MADAPLDPALRNLVQSLVDTLLAADPTAQQALSASSSLLMTVGSWVHNSLTPEGKLLFQEALSRFLSKMADGVITGATFGEPTRAVH